MRVLLIIGTLLALAACTTPTTQATPGHPAPAPDYGSKAYGY